MPQSDIHVSITSKIVNTHQYIKQFLRWLSQVNGFVYDLAESPKKHQQTLDMELSQVNESQPQKIEPF